jgi:flagellar biosynthetic protein FlhB
LADSSKTEQASPRKRQKAREKGQIVRSRDLMSSLALGTAVVLMPAQVLPFVRAWRDLFHRSLEKSAVADFGASGVLAMLGSSALLRIVALVVGLSWMAAMLGAVAQGGLVFAASALQPNFSRLSPVTRMGQLFSLPSVGRLLKSVIPGSTIVVLAGSLVCRDWGRISTLTRLGAPAVGAFDMQRLYEIAWKAALVLLVWSGVDYLIERQKFEGDLRMSRQDQRDEYKETEGHPTVKARIRRLRRQVLRKRMLEETKKASVVITNPNEFAIALEYRPEMPAPVVLAKGRNLLAQQIKQVARWHGIALVENPPLAHALYRAVEVGQSIPPKLYAVVAAVLAAVYRAQERASQSDLRKGRR